MPVLIAMKFDGGLKRYAAGIKSELDGLKNFSKLWKMVIEYFEGRSDVTGFVNISPFVDIWNSEGHIIGGNWTNTAKYETWKAKNYKRFRKFPMPRGFKGGSNAKQVLSGQTLSGLVNSHTPGAIRSASTNNLIYGIDNAYSKKWQDKRHLLDFFGKMNKNLNRVIANFVMRNAKDLEAKE